MDSGSVFRAVYAVEGRDQGLVQRMCPAELTLLADDLGHSTGLDAIVVGQVFSFNALVELVEDVPVPSELGKGLIGRELDLQALKLLSEGLEPIRPKRDKQRQERLVSFGVGKRSASPVLGEVARSRGTHGSWPCRPAR
jgi:hypothetical protein